MPMMKETTLTRRAEHCGCRECWWLKANKISAHPEKATLITELKEPLRKLMLKHSKPSWVWADGLVEVDANGDALIVEAADCADH